MAGEQITHTLGIFFQSMHFIFLQKTLNNGIPTYRQRQLLLFNDMVICSAKKESRMSWIVSTESTAKLAMCNN